MSIRPIYGSNHNVKANVITPTTIRIIGNILFLISSLKKYHPSMLENNMLVLLTAITKEAYIRLVAIIWAIIENPDMIPMGTSSLKFFLVNIDLNSFGDERYARGVIIIDSVRTPKEAWKRGFELLIANLWRLPVNP